MNSNYLTISFLNITNNNFLFWVMFKKVCDIYGVEHYHFGEKYNQKVFIIKFSIFLI